MKLNIIVGSADLPWIAGRLARELVNRLPAYGVRAAINKPNGADMDFHQIIYGAPDRRPAVGMFTHGDFRPLRYGSSFDAVVCLNPVMAEHARQGGASIVLTEPLPVADDFMLSRPLRFGVCGRTYGDGRKGEALVEKMVQYGYGVRAMGSGWPCPTVPLDLAKLPEFYRSLDYYVDTSTDEGGCVPALEALACGVPVISHSVGVTHPVISYERGSWDSLHFVLKGLTEPRRYGAWAEKLARFFLLIHQGKEVTR